MSNANESGALVQTVKEVSLSLIKTDKGADALLIVAEGEVSSTGWTNPQLVPYTCVQPPSDGTREFAFAADPPQGISQPVLTPIRAEFIVTNVPDWLTGVRVHAKTNCQEVHFK